MAEPARTAEELNMECFRISRELGGLAFSVPEAAPLARHLLRVAGRILVDTAVEGADPAVWANTESMALQWIDEALAALGYRVTPDPESGRSPLVPPDAGW